MLKFKIIGTNDVLKKFLKDCETRNIEISRYNSFFREDYEHCLVPYYAFDETQPFNTKLQTLSTDKFHSSIVFDLKVKKEYAIALSICESLISEVDFLKRVEQLKLFLDDSLGKLSEVNNLVKHLDFKKFKEGGITTNTEAATEYVTQNGGKPIDFSASLLALNKELEKQKKQEKYEADTISYLSDFVCNKCKSNKFKDFLFLYEKKALNRETWECEKCKTVINTRLAPQKD